MVQIHGGSVAALEPGEEQLYMHCSFIVQEKHFRLFTDICQHCRCNTRYV